MPDIDTEMAYGVSNSFRRGLLRTYSRRSRVPDDDGHPRKLIRMDDDGFVKVETTNGRHNILSIKLSELPDGSLKEKEASQQHQQQQRQSQTHLDQESVTSYAPSTPVRESIFSDPSLQASSPLSSPGISPIAVKMHKPTFNLLKRKRSGSNMVEKDSTESSRPGTPLTEITGNDRSSSYSQTSTGSAGRAGTLSKKPRLTQMTLDLGQDTRRMCKGCGMAYIASSAEDSALHKAFHSTNIGGVDVGRAFSKEARVVGSGIGETETIVLVDRKSSLALRRKVEKVMEVVRQDLGAVPIDPGELWDTIPCPVSGRKFGKALARAKEKGEDEEPREDRFKAFLFIDRERCVGLCLAERIGRALRVADSAKAKQDGKTTQPGSSDQQVGVSSENHHSAGIRSSCVTAQTTTDSVLLGVSRVWTSRSHRRKGVASALLDCARTNYFYGIEIPKEMVAFSQPTDSGSRLARQWYGKEYGWHVYEC